MIAVERVRFAPIPALLTCAVGLGMALFAVLPTAKEYVQVTDDRPPDAYSLAYLRVLVRADPHDERVALVYVRQLRTLGQLDEALAVLAAMTNPSLEADNLRLDLLLERARALPVDSAERRVAFDDVKPQLRAVLRVEERPSRLEELARLELELEEPSVAATIYWRAAGAAGADRARLLATAARWMVAAGDNRQAARAYELAATAEPDSTRASRYALQALGALEADARVCDGASLADTFAALHPTDPELLQRTVSLDEACGRGVAARDTGRRLLALLSASIPLVEQQLRLELAVGDVNAALPLVQHLVDENPGDKALHVMEARIAEWSNHPDLALRDWLALLVQERGPDTARLVR